MSILTRNKKVAAGVGVAAAAAAAIALGTGTYAAFTDQAAGPGGTLAAGTLTLQVNGGTSAATLFDASGLKPGTGPVNTVTVNFANTGSLAGTLSGTESLDLTGGTLSDKVARNTALAGQLQQASSCSVNNGTPVTTNATAVSSVQGNVISSPLSIPAGGTAACTFTFTFPDLSNGGNNTAQGGSVIVSSNFTLTQA